jgi:soluble lytic murein transglycosylase-like protein
MCGAAATAMQGGNGSVSVVRSDPHTGRLVRKVVRTEPQVWATPSAPIAETVDRIAEQNQISPQLVHSVIQVESNYDANAVSPKGAQGLMQLIPSTARRFGVSNVFDPADNIKGGARYLKHLLELYKGDEALALAAYNAGEGAVTRYGGIPPFPETQGYVAKVQQRLLSAGTRKPATPAEDTQLAEAGEVEAHHPIREVMDANGKIYYISR